MNIIFTEMRKVTDAQVVMIESARFRGSEPFRGVFQVHDVDTCSHVDESTGKRLLLVRCCWENEPDHEDAYLEVEWNDTMTNDSIGYDGEVVARMAFAKEDNLLGTLKF